MKKTKSPLSPYELAMQVCERSDQLKASMRIPVMLDFWEGERIMINRLIEIRNGGVDEGKDMTHFDKVLLHFLDADEFQKYVVKNKPLKP